MNQHRSIEDREILHKALDELPAAQREAAELFLQAESNEQLHRQLGDRKYKATERNFERALKRLEHLRESGRFPT